MKRTRRNHGATLKAQVALAAVKGDKTLAELAEQFSVHPTQITEWKQQLLARAADVFGGANSKTLMSNVVCEDRQLTLRMILGGGHQGRLGERKTMIDRTHPHQARQCQLLKLARRPPTIS